MSEGSESVWTCAENRDGTSLSSEEEKYKQNDCGNTHTDLVCEEDVCANEYDQEDDLMMCCFVRRQHILLGGAVVIF